jgi:hypothetical protein
MRWSTLFLVAIGTWHAALTVGALALLYRFNVDEGGFPLLGDNPKALWVNAALIGFVGSLLYFGRKAYVYLIEEKFRRIELEMFKVDKQGSACVDSPQRLRGRLAGYYMYLCLRPVAGLVLGPAIAMLFLGGVTTLSKAGDLNASALSPAALYLIYLFALVGGYTSSDMFDYLSKLGRRIFKQPKA